MELELWSVGCGISDLLSGRYDVPDVTGVDVDDVKLNVEFLVGIVYIEFLWQIEYTCC